MNHLSPLIIACVLIILSGPGLFGAATTAPATNDGAGLVNPDVAPPDTGPTASHLGGPVPAGMRTDEYSYDDGGTDSTVGGFDGELAWMHLFVTQAEKELVTHVSTAFGSPYHPGTSPPAGTPVRVFVWDDPTNDSDPTDAVLLGQGSGVIENPETDILTHYALDSPVVVRGVFFIGASVELNETQYPAPSDTDQDSLGRAWMTAAIPPLDPYDLTNNNVPPVEMDDYGISVIWRLRADAQPGVHAECESFDGPDRTDIGDWDEEAGNWTISSDRLRPEAEVPTQQWITRHHTTRFDGCIQGRAVYGSSASLRYIGLTARYIGGSYILAKIQDNAQSGHWDSFWIYDGGTPVVWATGMDYGTSPLIRLNYTGTSAVFQIDVDDDGSWEYEYPATITTADVGRNGVCAYTPFDSCYLDDWCYGSDCEAYGGDVVDFDGVPQAYWFHGDRENLGEYYPGLSFGPWVNILETTVYGYNESEFPYHSHDALITYVGDNQLRIEMDRETDHVGLWYTSANETFTLRAYGAQTTLIGTVAGPANYSRNDYLCINTPGIRSLVVEGINFTIDDFQWQPQYTVGGSMDCYPGGGTVPFTEYFDVTLNNRYDDFTRRIATRISVALAGGQVYANWKSGWTNINAGDSYSTSFSATIPALQKVIGQNTFTLLAEDVTPAPYNQPPYPPAGDTATDSCVVTAYAP